MTIKIYSDRIDIGDFTLFEGNGGLQFDGVARAENFSGNQGFQGSISGYTSGGGIPTLNRSDKNEKFPFATDTNSSSVGNLVNVVSPGSLSGHSSTTHGYVSGGYLGPGNTTNTIQKFPFTTDTNATDVGDLTRTTQRHSATSSPTYGYAAGGFASQNTIDRFPFTTDTNATDVGDLTRITQDNIGNNSTTHGYSSGGFPASPPYTSVSGIDKYNFAVTSNATEIADLAQAVNVAAGQSSTTHGYQSGGSPGFGAPNPSYNTIQKFPFATDTNGTDIGDLSQTRTRAASQSSTQSGYSSGGYLANPPAPPSPYNTIDKFPFTTDSNATDVGDLTDTTNSAAGSQD